MNYADFIASKRRKAQPIGADVRASDVHPMLFEWQSRIVRWALRTGRAAIFADCGLGKSLMQIEWARLAARRSLIIAPLSVARQTVREAARVGLTVPYVRSGALSDGVSITNVEMADKIDLAGVGAVVLDESSILKNVDGSTRKSLTEMVRDVPLRLACTATPAPNDVEELCNHAEWLGVLPRVEMLAAYFLHDEDGWRPKRHAVGPMFDWMSTWAVALRKPSDIGGDDTGYTLPPLSIEAEVVDYELVADGMLFGGSLGGVRERATVRRDTTAARVDRAVAIANATDDQSIVWCGTNAEADGCAAGIDGAENVHGSMTPDEKAMHLEAFQDGKTRVLVTKPRIAGFGMNFQNAARMSFVGLSDSYEAYYQAIRRCWRFGQKRPVDVRVVVSGPEMQIVENVRRKEVEARAFTSQLVARVHPSLLVGVA